MRRKAREASEHLRPAISHEDSKPTLREDPMRPSTPYSARPRARARTALLASTALGACQVAEGAATGASGTAYGAPVGVGRGTVRPYVTTRDGAPTELGVALSEGALDGLPTTGVGHHGGGGPVHQYVLDLPATRGLPFRFVEVNWNPMGHEPGGVYQDVPHFDFHFYTIDRAARDRIVPTDPEYAARANRLPTGDFVPPFVVQLGPPGAPPAAAAVPRMGVHWVDVRSAELQALLGKPEGYRPFTATFIRGSWDGRFIFEEPMITRAHLLAKKGAADPATRDEIIPIPVPTRYAAPGHYPTAYRITWDADTREYRVALTRLARGG